MSTITIVAFKYHCRDNNTDGNDSHTIATIAQPYCIDPRPPWNGK